MIGTLLVVLAGAMAIGVTIVSAMTIKELRDIKSDFNELYKALYLKTDSLYSVLQEYKETTRIEVSDSVEKYINKDKED